MNPRQISFDLVMEYDMDFVEGCYCDVDGIVKVFVISKMDCAAPTFKPVKWQSGVAGVNITVPLAQELDRPIALRLLANFTGIADWQVVAGPDSTSLR